jgi:hypothetical protein
MSPAPGDAGEGTFLLVLITVSILSNGRCRGMVFIGSTPTWQIIYAIYELSWGSRMLDPVTCNGAYGRWRRWPD